MLDYLSDNYKILAPFGIILIIAGLLLLIGGRGAGIIGSESVSGTGLILVWGGSIHLLGVGTLSLSLMGGAILDEKQNQYVRLGMLVVTGLLIGYGIATTLFLIEFV